LFSVFDSFLSGLLQLVFHACLVREALRGLRDHGISAFFEVIGDLEDTRNLSGELARQPLEEMPVDAA
jgi:hypothetical protein